MKYRTSRLLFSGCCCCCWWWWWWGCQRSRSRQLAIRTERWWQHVSTSESVISVCWRPTALPAKRTRLHRRRRPANRFIASNLHHASKLRLPASSLLNGCLVSIACSLLSSDPTCDQRTCMHVCLRSYQDYVTGTFNYKRTNIYDHLHSQKCRPCIVKSTSGSAMAEGPRDALSVEILQLQNIPFEN